MTVAEKPESLKRDLESFVQQFEQDLAQSKALLKETGTLSPSGVGNISLRIPGEDRLVIGSLNGPLNTHPTTSAVVDFDLALHGGVLPGYLKEVTPLHIAILRERPDVNAVIHAHAPYLTGFALAGKSLPFHYSALLRYGREDGVPVAEWGPRYAPAPVLKALGEHPDAPAVLLANHGPFAWAQSVLDAARFLVLLEEGARFTYLAGNLGGAKPLSAGAHEAVAKGIREFRS